MLFSGRYDGGKILVYLTFFLVMISLGCVEETPSSKPQETTTTRESTPVQLITKDPSHIILSKTDLPSGFKLVEHQSKENIISVRYEMGGNSTAFIKNNPTYVGVLSISNIVAKLNSMSEAQKAFDNIDKKFSNEAGMKLATDVIGDETSLYFKKGVSTGSRQLNGYSLLFREKNIIIEIFLIGLNTDMNEVTKYARIVDKKIIGEVPTTTKPPTTTPSPTPEILEISFYKFDSLFGAGGTLTDVQKKEVFRNEYKGKYVRWTCRLYDIKELWGFGEYLMYLKCKSSTIGFDLTVLLRKDQKDIALTLQKGRPVEFIARLTDYGEFIGHEADDGIIVK